MSEPQHRSAPWWSWLLPASVFLFFLLLFWPRPYVIPRGDGMKYYSAARHLTTEGRYYEDYSARPAGPLTMHPPLQSMLWAGLMRAGLNPEHALLALQAMFLTMLGAAGGVLAYRITGTWIGVAIWTTLSCAWPGGVNWILWVRPLTEAGTAAFFVLSAWTLSNALRSSGRASVGWLLLAGVLAGLSMLLKVTGAFTFPLVGIVALLLWRRSKSLAWGGFVVLACALMLLPYAAWAWRNLQLVGVLETNKPSHDLSAAWPLMQVTCKAIAQWFLPAQIAERLVGTVHPLMVLVPFVFCVMLLCWQSRRARRPEALLAGSLAAIAFALLGIALLSKFTEEARYWSVMIPCCALAVLSVPLPRGRIAGHIARLVLALFLMFCAARFVGSHRSLWYATQVGFVVQQVVLAAGLLAGVYCIHQSVRGLWRNDHRPAAHLAAVVVCAMVTLAYWQYASAARPLVVLLPLLLVPLALSCPFPMRRSALLCRGLVAALALAATWTAGKWSREDVRLPESVFYVRDGVRVKISHAEARGRQYVQESTVPRLFASNVAANFNDLFEGRCEVPLCPFPDEARFRAGLPQRPRDQEQALSSWVRQLRADHLQDEFLAIFLPQAGARSRFYGPEILQTLPGIEVHWALKDPDLHIAICRLAPAAETAQRRATLSSGHAESAP